MKFLHARHATSILTYAGTKFLIDPVLSDKEIYPPIPLTPNKRNNPLVSLKTPIKTLLDIDVILSTHIHRDHFDDAAKKLLDKNLNLICQYNDVNDLNSYGFNNLIPVEKSISYENIVITRVDAQHGTGMTGKLMGKASGYILSSNNEPTIYITGDTIFNSDVEDNIIKYKPEILIINAGSPKFLNSDQIVMNILDVENTLKVNPSLAFIIVHLDSFNHCIETREDMHEYFSPEKLSDIGVENFYIPEDNESLNF